MRLTAKAIAFTAFLLASVSLFAQENETSIKYSNITEVGITTASPQSFGFEATTAHGVSIEKAHNLGMGFGIGFNVSDKAGFNLYMPVFFNYRLYFKPQNKFTPHFNVALGMLVPADGMGYYSAVTMGFRSGKFSFSSGLSFLPVYRKGEVFWDGRRSEDKWYFPFGITIKAGFAF